MNFCSLLFQPNLEYKIIFSNPHVWLLDFFVLKPRSSCLGKMIIQAAMLIMLSCLDTSYTILLLPRTLTIDHWNHLKKNTTSFLARFFVVYQHVCSHGHFTKNHPKLGHLVLPSKTHLARHSHIRNSCHTGGNLEIWLRGLQLHSGVVGQSTIRKKQSQSTWPGYGHGPAPKISSLVSKVIDNSSKWGWLGTRRPTYLPTENTCLLHLFKETANA